MKKMLFKNLIFKKPFFSHVVKLTVEGWQGMSHQFKPI